MLVVLHAVLVVLAVVAVVLPARRFLQQVVRLELQVPIQSYNNEFIKKSVIKNIKMGL